MPIPCGEYGVDKARDKARDKENHTQIPEGPDYDYDGASAIYNLKFLSSWVLSSRVAQSLIDCASHDKQTARFQHPLDVHDVTADEGGKSTPSSADAVKPVGLRR